MDASLEEFELQQELQRVTTQFVERVTQASEILEASVRPGVRDEALRKNLLYVSSAMEICTGPVPQVNLLDMTVFVRLSRTVLEHYWIPQVYGEDARELAGAFSRFEEELAAMAARALSPAQREQLASAIGAWLAENPAQIRVEGVRLADFAAAAAEPVRRAKSLLSSVTTARRAANQAILLSERGLFLFHRMPSLWRLQARLGAREILGDALAHLARRGALYLALLGGGLLMWRFGGSPRLLRRAW